MNGDRRLPFGWLILALVVAAGAFGLYLWGAKADAPKGTGVAVVGAKAAALAPMPDPSPTKAQPATAVASPELAAAHAMRAYAMLYDVRIACTGDRCTLHGMIRPPTGGQAELDKRQEMLLGGLAASLGGDGYKLIVPFKMDEIAENRFRIEAAVIPAPALSPGIK